MKGSSSSEETPLFPIHHKHRYDDAMLSLQNVSNVGSIDICSVIQHAYMAAVALITDVGIGHSLTKHELLGIERCSDNVYEHFHRTKRIFDDSGIFFDDETLEFDDVTSDEENDFDNDDEDDDDDRSNGFDDPDGDVEVMSSHRMDYHGVRLVNEVSPSSRCSYFEIKFNGQIKYLHKQSAVWLLTDKKKPSFI